MSRLRFALVATTLSVSTRPPVAHGRRHPLQTTCAFPQVEDFDETHHRWSGGLRHETASDHSSLWMRQSTSCGWPLHRRDLTTGGGGGGGGGGRL